MRREHSEEVRQAENPFTVLRYHGWTVLKDTWRASVLDNVSLVASGAAFWCFAAIVPLLAAMVLTYGLFATPHVLARNMRSLFGLLPSDAASLISDQLAAVVKTSSAKKGWGLALALLLALYGAIQGALAVIGALNIAYEEEETRSLPGQYALALLITLATILFAFLAAGAMSLLAFVDHLVPDAPSALLTAITALTYLLLAVLVGTAAALLYRFAPDRTPAKWIWLTPGSLLATLLWLIVTSSFALYVAQFGHYGATYGTLGAVIVLQFWLWLSAYAFLLGGELNSQLERRTAKDTTVGPPAPLGSRGAAVADSVGPNVNCAAKSKTRGYHAVDSEGSRPLIPK